MGEIAIGWFSLRELLIGAIAGLWIYVIYSFLRLQQMKRRHELFLSPPPEFREPALGSAGTSPAAKEKANSTPANKDRSPGSAWEKNWEKGLEKIREKGWEDVRQERLQESRSEEPQSERPGQGGRNESKNAPGAWFEPPERFIGEDRVEDAERQIGILRDEVAALRGELAALRNELWQQVERMKASQHISPIYGDAMQMASAGYDAGAIAERCGITRAEAELIAALGKRPEEE